MEEGGERWAASPEIGRLSVFPVPSTLWLLETISLLAKKKKSLSRETRFVSVSLQSSAGPRFVRPFREFRVLGKRTLSP